MGKTPRACRQPSGSEIVNASHQQSLLPGAGQLETERRLFYGELLRFEATRGYRPGWSDRAFVDRFGTSPPRAWANDQPSTYISPETFNWVRGRSAAFARSRATRERR
jgi:hypothetical protein